MACRARTGCRLARASPGARQSIAPKRHENSRMNSILPLLFVLLFALNEVMGHLVEKCGRPCLTGNVRCRSIQHREITRAKIEEWAPVSEPSPASFLAASDFEFQAMAMKPPR